MTSSASYPIEEFLEAITAQLDQTQDALRLKAVNRPLTFALKDFNVDLKVFVEMDTRGRVAFRPAAPNETGASSVSIGFTTITRPMIEENTISMEMARAPGLTDLGLGEQEQRKLAKIGVRNAAQLRRMQDSAGEDALSQHTGLDVGRIRSALELTRPRLDAIQTDRPEASPADPGPRPGPSLPGGSLVDRLRHSLTPGDAPATPAPERAPARKLPLAPGARQIRLEGRNLTDGGRPPVAHLDGRPLGLIEASTRAVAFALPPGEGGGRLRIELPDGDAQEFDLVTDTAHPRGAQP